MPREKLFFFIVSILISSTAGRCTCGTGNKGGIEIVYHGESCDCARKLPFFLDIPELKKSDHKPVQFAYEIEIPKSIPEPEIMYKMDVEIEKPEMKSNVKLGTISYQIELPAEKKDDVRYVFDYMVDMPSSKPNPVQYEDLVTEIDRVLLPKKDCESCQKTCRCRGPNPTIDILRSCPDHGHLYRENAHILPLFLEKRYANHKPEFIDSIIYNRHKRQLSNLFERDAFEDLFKDFDHEKMLSDFTSASKKLMRAVTPVLQSTFRALLSEEDSPFSRLISKREITEKYPEEDDEEDKNQSEETTKKESDCSTIENLKKNGDTERLQKAEVLQYMPEVKENRERTRKHCPSCGSVTQHQFPCTKCGHSEPFEESEFFELLHGNPVPYVPGKKQAKTEIDSRFAFDRLGHRYNIQENGNLQLSTPAMIDSLDPAFVGSSQYDSDDEEEHSGHEYKVLHDILDNHPDFQSSINAYSGMIEPPVTIAMDVVEFMRDTFLGPREHDEEDDEDQDTYETKSAKRFITKDSDLIFDDSIKSQSKRGFDIIPILQDKQDGSVLVKITPKKNGIKQKLKKIDFEKFELPLLVERELKSVKPKSMNVPKASGASFLKTLGKNGKQYEILTVPDSTDSNESEENMDILHYIYQTQKRKNQLKNSNKMPKIQDLDLDYDYNGLFDSR